jgi:cytochrome c553
MRHPRAGVLAAAIVAMAATLAVTTACGNGAGGSANHVYVRFECGKCHGDDREGARTAPPLTGLAPRWTEASLIEYMRDPQGVTRDTPRITLRNEQYPLKMPSYAAAAESDLSELARFLLTD